MVIAWGGDEMLAGIYYGVNILKAWLEVFGGNAWYVLSCGGH